MMHYENSKDLTTNGSILRVIQVFLVGRKPIGGTQGTLVVARHGARGGLKLLLRSDGAYREVGMAIALGYLNRADQHSLLAVLNRNGAITLSRCEKNVIKRVPDTSCPARRTDLQMEAELLLGLGRPVLRDRGDILLTHSNSSDVATALVGIASRRKWEQISVSGALAFRHAVWAAADLLGMTVMGKRPQLTGTEYEVAIARQGEQSLPSSGRNSCSVKPGQMLYGLLNDSRDVETATASGQICRYTLVANSCVQGEWLLDVREIEAAGAFQQGSVKF